MYLRYAFFSSSLIAAHDFCGIFSKREILFAICSKVDIARDPTLNKIYICSVSTLHKQYNIQLNVNCVKAEACVGVDSRNASIRKKDEREREREENFISIRRTQLFFLPVGFCLRLEPCFSKRKETRVG